MIQPVDRNFRRQIPVWRVMLMATLVIVIALTNVAPALAAPSPNSPYAATELQLMRKLVKHGSSAVVYSEVCRKVANHSDLAALCMQVYARHKDQMKSFQTWSWLWYTELVNINKRDRMITKRVGAHWSKTDFEAPVMQGLSEHLKAGISLAQTCVNTAVHTELRDACQSRLSSDQAAAAQLDAWLAAWY